MVEPRCHLSHASVLVLEPLHDRGLGDRLSQKGIDLLIFPLFVGGWWYFRGILSWLHFRLKGAVGNPGDDRGDLGPGPWGFTPHLSLDHGRGPFLDLGYRMGSIVDEHLPFDLKSLPASDLNLSIFILT